MSCCDIICVEQADKTLKSTAFFVQFNANPYKTKRKVKVLVNDKHTDLELTIEPNQMRCYLFPPHKAETNDEVHKEQKAKDTAVESVDPEETKKNKKELKKKEPQLKRKKLFKSAVNYLFPEEKTLSNMETDKVHSLDQLTPTNEQLQELGLKDGLNSITFVLDGDEDNLVQAVDGSIFKWHVSDRIVLCDIDGTVTKSDTMGLILTAVGYYSYVHPGICSLLSSLEKKGYKILFLTARSITHGAKTRKFIQQIRQENDGKMPHGPILTSYNNLMHAAIREYILYRSETFKIEALRGIQSLFNKDENPFVIGLGNKPTDHESYVTVGIPIENIFIIDPAGKVKGLKSKKEYQYTGYEEVQHMLGDLLPDILLPQKNKEEQAQS